MSLSKIYCINLKDNIDRWKGFQTVHKRVKQRYDIEIERIDAVDARTDPQACLNEYGLTFSPFTISIGLYFYYSPAAVGCFLSHYKVWQKMISEKIPYAIIVEDDIQITSLLKFLETNTGSYKHFECTQLTKRVAHRPSYVFFHGSESYILSLNGAHKLIESVKTPSLLQNITDYEESLSINRYYASLKLPIPRLDANKIPANSIVAPSDQIFSLCCHSKCNNKVKLNYDINSCINLDPKTCKSSTISPTIQAWKARTEHIEEYFTSIKQNQLFRLTAQ